MNLCIDIGNTRTKLAVFDGVKLRKKLTWNNEDWNQENFQSFLQKQQIKNIALATVKNLDTDLILFLEENYYFLNLDSRTPIPILNRYKTPRTLGKDRLAAVVGAFELYPNQNALVIDAGTCITYDILSKEGEYHGGNISPGISLRFRAMNEFTAKLPLVRQRKQEEIIGQNTVTSIRIGAQWGAILEMEGFIKSYKKTFTKINVILTGGDADFFAFNLKTKIFVNRDLVLIGLNKILNYNVQQ